MKSDKLKKLLKQIKKLKKLKKARRIKRTKKITQKNVLLSAELETLKDKFKNQELQLSQIRNPQQAPVSRVSYEALGIGQQNALNQSNLENIEKKYIKNFEEQEKALKEYYKQKLLIDREQDDIKLKSDGVGDFSQKRFAKSKQQVIDPSITNKINLLGQPRDIVYSQTDNQGEFPRTDFDTSIRDMFTELDRNVDDVDNQIKTSLYQPEQNILSEAKAVQEIQEEPVSVQSRKLRAQKEGESDEEYDKYIKKSYYNYNYRTKNKSVNTSKFNSPKVINDKTVKIDKKDLSNKELSLLIPNFKDTIDVSQKIENLNKEIKQKESDIFNAFSDY